MILSETVSAIFPHTKINLEERNKMGGYQQWF